MSGYRYGFLGQSARVGNLLMAAVAGVARVVEVLEVGVNRLRPGTLRADLQSPTVHDPLLQSWPECSPFRGDPDP